MKPLTGKELGILEACQIGKTTRNLRRTTTMQNNPAYPYMLEKLAGAGLIIHSEGQWRITAKGKQALEAKP
mgnify:CR=1 FL=1